MESTTQVQDLLPRLVSCIREELEAQQRILAIIERQRLSIASDRGRKLEEQAGGMLQEMRSAPDRGNRRDAVLAELAEDWKLDPSEVTLSMVILRFGRAADELAELRAELRKTSAEVVRSVRKFSALVSTQRRLIHDVLRALLDSGVDPGRSERSEGVLLDAEA